MMLMNVIGESVKFFGKKVYLRKLYKSSRSYENRINKHVVISLKFPCLIASLLSFFADVFFSVRFVVRICVEVAVDRILRISTHPPPPPLHSLPLFFFF